MTVAELIEGERPARRRLIVHRLAADLRDLDMWRQIVATDAGIPSDAFEIVSVDVYRPENVWLGPPDPPTTRITPDPHADITIQMVERPA